MFGAGSKITFRDLIQGTWGNFRTPAGRVDYIMTKARLGGNADDHERQLTKNLAPVREIMDPGDLDFNQLLQRDLDDHRVAVQLIPYLLKPETTGPAFLPPIVAVLLPFQAKRPSVFPELGVKSSLEEDGATWEAQQAGDAFRIQKLLDDKGNLHSANVGKLWWNRSEASLVVLDGQHRAMALLAIERTMTNSWQDTSGSKYRSFYEHQVRQVLEEHAESGLDLSSIEVPVTVCWFPSQTGAGSRPHEAARKLFVDVNKEAKPPSESRIILLSDGELINVLTRSMLSVLRNDKNPDLLPLYAIEYDNPEVNSNRPARWSVLTNIHLLKLGVNRCIFGPPKYLRNLSKTLDRGSESATARDEFMREQLELESLFPAPFEDGDFSFTWREIGDKNFPLGKMDVISQRFSETWGSAMLTLLSQVAPYAAHAQSLKQLDSDWLAADTFAALAKDAIFGGVGVFWTLRDSHHHFQEAKLLGGRPGVKSDVVRAWEALQAKKADFEDIRAHIYLGSKSEKQVAASNGLFSVMNTHACQLGMIMTMGSLWELRKGAGSHVREIPLFAQALVNAWNAFFGLGHGSARDRRVAFSRSSPYSINQIDKMDASMAFHFRYFWMQALTVPEAWEQIHNWISDREVFNKYLSEVRNVYLDLCTKQQLDSLKKQNPTRSENSLRGKAQAKSYDAVKRALREWFYVTDGDLEGFVLDVHRGGVARSEG